MLSEFAISYCMWLRWPGDSGPILEYANVPGRYQRYRPIILALSKVNSETLASSPFLFAASSRECRISRGNTSGSPK